MRKRLGGVQGGRALPWTGCPCPARHSRPAREACPDRAGTGGHQAQVGTGRGPDFLVWGGRHRASRGQLGPDGPSVRPSPCRRLPCDRNRARVTRVGWCGGRRGFCPAAWTTLPSGCSQAGPALSPHLSDGKHTILSPSSWGPRVFPSPTLCCQPAPGWAPFTADTWGKPCESCGHRLLPRLPGSFPCPFAGS